MNYDPLDLSVLKTLCTNKKYALEFCNDSDPKLFHSDLWRFAKVVLDYCKVYKVPPTKRTLLEQVKKNEAQVKYLGDTWDKVSATNYDEKEYSFDLERLKNRYSEKLIVELQKNLSNADGKVDVKKSIAEIQGALNNVKSVNGVKSFKEGSIQDYIKEFDTIYKAKVDNPDFGMGFLTGFSFIDSVNNGFKPGEVGMLGGITSAGKSILLGNLAVQMWLGQNTLDTTANFRPAANVLIISLEMSYLDYWDRILARMCMIPQKSLANATLTKEEKEKVSKLFRFVKAYNQKLKVIDIPKLTVGALETIINNERSMGNNFDVVLIDYMNLIKATETDEKSDWLQQASISEEIHTLARSMEIVILSAVQINPKKEKSNDGAGFGIQNIRRSTQIIDNVDLFAVIQSRPNEKNY